LGLQTILQLHIGKPLLPMRTEGSDELGMIFVTLAAVTSAHIRAGRQSSRMLVPWAVPQFEVGMTPKNLAHHAVDGAVCVLSCAVGYASSAPSLATSRSY